MGRFSGSSSVHLEIEPLRSIPTEFFRVTRSTATTILSPEDGRTLTRVRYTLQNSVEQFLQVELPREAKLLGVTVRNQPVKPGTQQGNDSLILVALPTSSSQGTQAPSPVQVELFYSTPLQEFSSFGSLDLSLCKPLVPVDTSTWTLYYPKKFSLEHRDGKFQPQRVSLMDMEKMASKELSSMSRRANRYSSSKLLSQVAMPSNMAMPGGYADPKEQDRSRDVGLLPVKLHLPESASLQTMTALTLEQGSVARGSDSWSVELSYLDQTMIGRGVALASLLLLVGVFLLLLSLSGGPTRTPGLLLLLAGLGFALLTRGASAKTLEVMLTGGSLGVLLAILWALATPFRRLSTVTPVVLGLLLGSTLPAAPGRLEALVPVPEKGPTQVPLNSSSRVLVSTHEVTALRKTLQDRKAPKPPAVPNEIIYGDQEITGVIADGLARLHLAIPVQVRGPGPWILPMVRGELAIEKSLLRKERQQPRPVTVSIQEDREIRILDQVSMKRYASFLSGTQNQATRKGRIGYQIMLATPSLKGFTSYVVELDCLIPAHSTANGGSQISLELPSASARKLDLRMPDEIRVTISGDSHPKLETLTLQTRVTAFPTRQGGLTISWQTKARHARKARPKKPPLKPTNPRKRAALLSGPPPPSQVSQPETKKEPLVLADWEIQMEVGEEQVRGVAKADLRILRSSLDHLTLVVPAKIKIVNIEGPRVAKHRPLASEGDNALYQVLFQSRRKGSFPVQIHFRLPLGETLKENRRSFQAPSFSFQECQDQRGRLGLRIQGSQEIRPLESQELEPTSPGAEEVLAYRILTVPFHLQVEVEALPPAPVFPATITRGSARSEVLSGETRRVTLEFQVKNNGRDFLTFRLPEGTIQESIQLTRRQNGRERMLSRVLDREGKLQVPLPQPPAGHSQPQVSNFKLKLDRKATPPKGWSGQETLQLPIPDLPISGEGLRWIVRIEKGFVLSRVDPGDGHRNLRPFEREAQITLRGFLPTTSATSVDSQTNPLTLQISFLSEGAMLGLFLLLFVAVFLLATFLPLLLLGRLEFGAFPRLLVLGLIGIGGVGVMEAELPLPAGAFQLALAGGGLASLALFLRSWKNAALFLLLLPLGIQAAPSGIDFRYLPSKDIQKKIASGRWSLLSSKEVRDLYSKSHAPPSKSSSPQRLPKAPRIRSANHQASVHGEATTIRSTYVVEGRQAKAWPLVIDIGPDAALVKTSVTLAGKAVTNFSVVPEGGPGSPRHGHPHPGVFRIRGLKGHRSYTITLESILPVIRRDGGGTFQVTCLPSAGSRFQVTLPDSDVHLEVFPSLSTKLLPQKSGTRIQGWLAPSSTFAVNWIPRSRPQTSPSPQKPGSQKEVTAVFDAEVFPLYRLDGRRLEGRHRITLRVSQGAVDQLHLSLPANEELLSVTGPGVERFQILPEKDGHRQAEVLFRAKKSGSWSLNLRTLRLLSKETSKAGRLHRQLSLFEVQVQGAQKQSGDLRLDLPAGVLPGNLKVTGATRIDPREARPPAPPNSLVFRYLTPGVTVRASLERFPPQQSSELIGQTGELTVVPIGKGRAAFVARYILTNRGRQSLRLQLPEGATLVSSQVNDRPVKAGRSSTSGEYRVPLAGSSSQNSGETTLRLNFVYIAREPVDHIIPPALPETTLEYLDILLSHGSDLHFQASSGPYQGLEPRLSFFWPLEKAASFLPKATFLILTAPVTVPLAMLATPFLVSSGGGTHTLLGAVGNIQDESFANKAIAPSPMRPRPPPSPGASGGAHFAKKSRRRSRGIQRQQVPQSLQAFERELSEKNEETDGFGDDRGEMISTEMVQQQIAGASPLNKVHDAPADLLLGEQSQGVLPVPLDFRAPDLRSTRFRTQFLHPGEHPTLQLAPLPRWLEHMWIFLATLLTAAGTFFLTSRRIGTLQSLPLLLGGLCLGLWLSWSYGSGGEAAWFGVLLGLGAELLDRVRLRWRGNVNNDSTAGSRQGDS
jgi:hypothetical protein